VASRVLSFIQLVSELFEIYEVVLISRDIEALLIKVFTLFIADICFQLERRMSCLSKSVGLILHAVDTSCDQTCTYSMVSLSVNCLQKNRGNGL
jgi:hypothetical protein